MSTFILTIKIIDFGVKEFPLVMRVLVRCFCALKLSKKIDLIPKRFFVWFFKDIYGFVKIFRLFFRCSELKIN
jgi:hypothetical protein